MTKTVCAVSAKAIMTGCELRAGDGLWKRVLSMSVTRRYVRVTLRDLEAWDGTYELQLHPDELVEVR